MQTCSGGISVRDVDQSLLIETDSKILLNRFIYSLDILFVCRAGWVFVLLLWSPDSSSQPFLPPESGRWASLQLRDAQ